MASFFGIFVGLSIRSFELSFNITSYTTDGDVAIKSIPYSLSILSSTISIWSSPKNPHLNPKPSAFDVSGSKVKAASFNFNLPRASLKSSNLLDSIGNIPE